MPLLPSTVVQRFELAMEDLAHFPWRTTAVTLRERFREDRLGLTASSLTFTTVLALVPFFTVALAVFTAFPMFAKAQEGLQRWLIDSLIPDSIARQVLDYLRQFASQASRLGVAGLSILLGTALALILTIDRTLNNIWRVREARPLGQRVLVYWAAITLGPLVLGLSLALTSYVVTASKGLMGAFPDGLRFALDFIEFMVLAIGMTGLYHYVPNTQVKWLHAWIGGLFVAVGIEIAKKVLSLYINAVPTYSAVYGAFATLPILLVWIYVSWVIVLLGAVVAAYLPSLLAGVVRRGTGHGWQFQLAVEVLQRLHSMRSSASHGMTAPQLARALQVDLLQLVPVLEALAELDWIGQLGDPASNEPGRYVLLADPQATAMPPLMERLLLPQARSLRGLWDGGRLRTLMLSDVLHGGV
jgi:membrane protein